MGYIWVYNNLESKNGKILADEDWSRKKNKYYSVSHGISSYLAMFCPALPDFFIKKYTKENDVVMDNFSGRGTTALVSRELNRSFVGSDLNPYAFVLSKFKIDKTSKEKILKHIDKMELEFNISEFKNLEINDKNEQIKELTYFYSNVTLRQLLFLRQNYGINWKQATPTINAILAFALGLMHGPTKKNGSTIYFSLKMPNTISMSPNYVKRYKKKNNLTLPEVNIFDQLRDRIDKKYDSILSCDYRGKIYFQDSTKENKSIKNNSIDLVVTSPPYLNIVNYTSSNWLKLWLLGYDRKHLRKDIKLSDSLKFNEYVVFIQNYLNAIYNKLKIGAKVCLIVGDVFNRNLIEEVWKKIKNNVKYRYINTYYDCKYLQTHKVTNMLNNKSGKATKIDKVLVIEKYE